VSVEISRGAISAVAFRGHGCAVEEPRMLGRGWGDLYFLLIQENRVMASDWAGGAWKCLPYELMVSRVFRGGGEARRKELIRGDI
jgi:hypothetical protein